MHAGGPWGESFLASVAERRHFFPDPVDETARARRQQRCVRVDDADRPRRLLEGVEPDCEALAADQALGNLLPEPRCSLLLVATEAGGPHLAAARAEVVEVPQALPLRWGPVELAPEFVMGSTW
jgi:hypothetical protein